MVEQELGLASADVDAVHLGAVNAFRFEEPEAEKALAAAGIENFVISADHGHQFAIRKDDDMKADNPGGDTLDLHRRCWIGHGGSTPSGTVRVTGAELGYDTDLDFVFPAGLGVFKAGGGLSFHHGGFSLQELAIPVISLRMAAGKPAEAPGVHVRIEGCPPKVTTTAPSGSSWPQRVICSPPSRSCCGSC